MSDLESFAQSRVGTTLRGKYRLEKLLGVGGMAAVYQATHRVGNRVAVKVLHPHMSINSDVRARFLREGYVANRVEHRGAVRVMDDDTAEDGSVFLAMELLQGETLEAYWHRRGERLPPREVAELAHQLLDVLAAAHEKGIVHRDIKPENLFLTDGGILKVLDFGIARLAGAAAPQGATRTGRMLGSPAYMAPEQALGLQRSIDGQTDLWSAAATMFTLISGRFVHEAETVEMMLVHAGSRPARSLSTVAPQVHAAIVRVVDRGLASDKAQRWPSAVAMQSALESAYLEAFGKAIPGAKALKPRLAIALTHDDEVPSAGRVSFGSDDSTAPTVTAGGVARASGLPQTVDATQYQAPVDKGATVVAGASTTAGIEPSGGEPVPPPGTGHAKSLVIGIATAIAVSVAAAAVLLARGTGPTTAAATASGAAPMESVVVPPPSAPSAPQALPSAFDAGALVAPPPPQPSPPPRPSPSPQRVDGGVVTPPPRPPPGPTPSAKPVCKPVSYFDDQGNQHFREECH